MWSLFFFSRGEEMTYSCHTGFLIFFFADWLDNMADLQMLKLKERDVSVTHMKQTGTWS